MNQARRKSERPIDDGSPSIVSEARLPPALAELADRTLAACGILAELRQKLRASEAEFRAAARDVVVAEEAAAAHDMTALGPKVIALSDANALKGKAAAAIAELTKQVRDAEHKLSALEDGLCRAAGDFLNPMQAAAATKYRHAAVAVKAARDEFVALSFAVDTDVAVIAHAMRAHLPDLETDDDLLFSPDVPGCPAPLELVRRAIREARLAYGGR